MKSDDIRSRVQGALHCLAGAAETYHGLFGSIIDRKTGLLLDDYPPAIPGQRATDRAPRGSNITHDQPTLATMLGCGDADLAAAADRYLNRFATHCTGTVTGLFPCGEHAFWNLDTDEPGNSYTNPDANSQRDLTHDHLRATPMWLFEKLHGYNADCVARFGEGLDNHWNPQPDGTREYIRHAYINKWEPWMSSSGKSSCDFPRHGGFYMFDWAVAHHLTGRTDMIERIGPMLDYWWEKRDDTGLCYVESRAIPEHILYDTLATAQTLSLGSSLLDAAELIETDHAALAAEMRRRAKVYIDGFFAAPHDLEAGVFNTAFRRSDGVRRDAAIWGSVYGKTPASYTSLNALAVYRRTSDARLLEFAEAAGRCYLNEPFPDDVQVPAMDAGMGLELLADLYDITRDATWRDGGLQCAEKIIGLYFDDQPLPRSASGIDHYDSQSGPGFLLHGLTRLCQLADDGDPLAPDYTGR